MKKCSILALAAFLSAAAVSSLSAQSAVTGSPGFSLGVGIGIGVQNFPNPAYIDGGSESEFFTYQSLTLIPELSVGKFALGFDFIMNYRFTAGSAGDRFEVREEDWVVGDFQEFLDVYLPKIRYLRYGLKGDPLHAKFGTIDDATLGNGFIMSGYSNALFLPDTRIFGLTLDLDGSLLDFPFIGFESFAGNVARFDVMATRLYTRPLAGTELPVLRHMQVGATVATDRDPAYFSDRYADLDPLLVPPPDASVLMYGADFRLPLLSNSVLALALFGDGVIQKEGSGAMVGFGGRLVQVVTYGAQLRFMEDYFIPSYFNLTYDIFRLNRYRIYDGEEEKKGGIGWFATLGLSALADKLVLVTTAEGPLGAREDNYFSWQGIFMVKEGILPGFFFDVLYDKKNMAGFDDFKKWREDAFIRARLNYRTGPAIISLVYNLRYIPTAGGGDWQVTSGIESRISLY